MIERTNPNANEAKTWATTTEHTSLSVEAAAVRAHLETMLDVINRTATNSRSCKVWCITVVSAILALISCTENSVLILSK